MIKLSDNPDIEAAYLTGWASEELKNLKYEKPDLISPAGLAIEIKRLHAQRVQMVMDEYERLKMKLAIALKTLEHCAHYDSAPPQANSQTASAMNALTEIELIGREKKCSQ